MKKNLLQITRIFLFITFSMIFMQCGKDDETPQTPADKIIGTWQITADSFSPGYDYFSNGQLITELLPFYDACEKDDLLIFKSNSQGDFDESTLKCDPSDPQTFSFLWTLTNNGTTLVLDGEDFDVVQLDATTLKLKYPFVESGVTYTNTLTYIRK